MLSFSCMYVCTVCAHCPPSYCLSEPPPSLPSLQGKSRSANATGNGFVPLAEQVCGGYNYVYIRMYTYMCVCVHMCKCVCVCVGVGVCVGIWVYSIYIHTCRWVLYCTVLYVGVGIHTFTCIYICVISFSCYCFHMCTRCHVCLYLRCCTLHYTLYAHGVPTMWYAMAAQHSRDVVYSCWVHKCCVEVAPRHSVE